VFVFSCVTGSDDGVAVGCVDSSQSHDAPVDALLAEDETSLELEEALQNFLSEASSSRVETLLEIQQRQSEQIERLLSALPSMLQSAGQPNTKPASS
jgi:hypothetical protein